MDDYVECENLWCDNVAQEPHACPYAEEINDDSETTCTCCEICEGNCAADI